MDCADYCIGSYCNPHCAGRDQLHGLLEPKKILLCERTKRSEGPVKVPRIVFLTFIYSASFCPEPPPGFIGMLPSFTVIVTLQVNCGLPIATAVITAVPLLSGRRSDDLTHHET